LFHFRDQAVDPFRCLRIEYRRPGELAIFQILISSSTRSFFERTEHVPTPF